VRRPRGSRVRRRGTRTSPGAPLDQRDSALQVVPPGAAAGAALELVGGAVRRDVLQHRTSAPLVAAARDDVGLADTERSGVLPGAGVSAGGPLRRPLAALSGADPRLAGARGR